MTGTPPALPLQGIRVLDVAHVIAGPHLAARLGDFGADVLKVEKPHGGDTSRQLGWKVGGQALWWKHLGRNKRSVTLDLSIQGGQDLLTELATSADVLIEAFRPGVMERWNLGPDRLGARNPRLVYVRFSGFGQTGPYAQRPCLGTVAEAMSGFVHMNGIPGQPPLLPPIALADEVAALFGCYGVMLALYARDARGGAGQVVDISLVETLFNILGPLALARDKLGVVVGPTAGGLPFSAPRGTYRTAEGRWLSLSGTAPSSARGVLWAVGGPSMAEDERFSTGEARLANVEELDRLIAEWVGRHRLDEALEGLRAEGVAAGPVLDVAEVMDDAHFKERGMLVPVADPDLGEVRVPAVQPRLGATPGRIRGLGAHLGEHTDQVLAAELGLSAAEIEALRRDGVV